MHASGQGRGLNLDFLVDVINGWTLIDGKERKVSNLPPHAFLFQDSTSFERKKC